jgi:hypothetical protein
MMEKCERLWRFMERAAGDPRLMTVHVSLYVTLLYLHSGGSAGEPVAVTKDAVMQVAKISARSTYQKTIRELHDYAYIRYVPSYNHFLTSLVYFVDE